MIRVKDNPSKIAGSYSMLVLLLVFTFGYLPNAASTENSPRLGLTLSGGGAKGLAHIGVLHVLDSLGIRAELITGTSMGSVVGGLHAAGYSASEIEQIALNLDWEDLFSSHLELGFSHPRKRESYGKYIVELPIEKGRFILPSGAIEGQKLWNTLGELFFHVRDIHDFSEFPIPFACVATDVSNGNAIVMNKGDIITAIRASMAIPSIFTTVNRDGLKLIDGGVVQNFPVKLAREMGSDLIIGVNVSQGLRTAEQLNTPIDIIYQMGFYLDAQNFEENRNLVDVYIAPELTEFTAGSFNSAQVIIERGKTAAREQIPNLLMLKSQLSQSEPKVVFNHQNRQKSALWVDTIVFKGLDNIRPWFVRSLIPVESGDSVSFNNITNFINKLYATDYFTRISYHFIPVENSNKGILEFEFDEKPFARFGTAIHYSSFTGVGLIGSLTTNKLLFYNTGGYAKVLVGEKPAFKAGIDFFTSDRQNSWFNLETFGQFIIFPVFENFKNITDYRQFYFRTEANYFLLSGQNSFLSMGLGWYYQSLAPQRFVEYTVKGHTHSNELYLRWKHNSLNRNAFPQSGTSFNVSSTFFFNQNPSLKFENPEGLISRNLKEVDIIMKNYLQVGIDWQSYIPINGKNTLNTQLAGGYNFNYEQRFINMFNLGGTYPFLRNQIAFAGLNEYQVLSKSILLAGLEWQYNIWESFFVNPVVNAAIYDFELESIPEYPFGKYVLGAGINLGYLSPVGPLEISFTYSPQTDRVLAYINLGWTF